MQVLTAMTLFDSSGRGLTVYAPSGMAQNQGPPTATGFPPSIGIPSNGGWQQGPGPMGPPGSFTLAPMSSGIQQGGMPTTLHLNPPSLNPMAMLSGPLQLAPLQNIPTAPPVAPVPVTPAAPVAPIVPLAQNIPGAPPGFYYSNPVPVTPISPMPLQAPVVTPPPPYAPGPPPATPAYTSPTPAGPPAPSPSSTPAPIPNYLVQQNTSGTNLYISNLPEYITKEGLQELFAPHGTILSCHVARKQGQCPIGFVQFTEPDMAQAAVAAVNGMMVEDGRFIRVKIADHDKDKGVKSNPSSDLYICNLPSAWSYADLHSAFSNYGKISSLTMFKDNKTGTNLGSGMVRYASTTEATSAIQGMNRMHFKGMDRPLEVKYAESRMEKDKRIANKLENIDDKGDGLSMGETQSIPGTSTPANDPINTHGQGQGQDMSAVQEFSRLMNNCSTNTAKQNLMSFNNGFQKNALLSKTPITPEVQSSEEAGRNPTASQGKQKFWDSVQGVLNAGPDPSFPMSHGNFQPGMPKPSGLLINQYEATDDQDTSPREEKAANANYRAWRNKRKQRRAGS